MGITEVELISAKPAVSSMKKKISELIKDGKLEIKENVKKEESNVKLAQQTH